MIEVKSNLLANALRGSAPGRRALTGVGATAMLAATLVTIQPVYAQSESKGSDSTAKPNSPLVDEVVVTGSRVVRDGYQAPTPVTVIGTEQLQQAPSQHISDFVNRLPAFAGGMSTTSGGNEISTGRQSQNNLNLRGLDVFRTLVLLDGHRIVSGDVNGAVNINDLPQSLINRVDVITGGASAAYGSDALAGVVNFGIDKEFTGVKGELQGGVSTHGDNDSYKVNLTAGTAFGGGRGHVIVSGEFARNEGVFGATASRDWGFDTVHILANPAYNPATGATSVPQFIIRGQASTLLATPGGIITGGPLRGTDFGPDGAPRKYQYGSLTNSQFNVGGDWRYSDVNYYNQSLANRLQRENAFARISYDITDDINVFFNFIQSDSTGYARSKLDDSLNNITISADNPYLDPSIAATMATQGLPSFSMGSFNLDMPFITTNNTRRMYSYAGGAEGRFTVFGDSWKWDVFAQQGISDSDINGRVMNRNNFKQAVDSVRTADGQIVCRVNSDASTANDIPGCVPWNPFGWGQNGPAAIAFSKGLAHLSQENKESVATAGVSGEPFSSWAGPVSIATGIEWRKEEVSGTPDALSLQSAYSAGNFKGTNGSYSVTEGYFETVVPLAKDMRWARSLDFNGAVRATDYSTSGYVTTWKAGLTYNPIDDVRFRVTRSRDIRAPNLGELFAAGTGGQSPGVLDPFHNNAPLPTFLNQTIGNPDLLPEKADTTGFGVVYQPSYLSGFSISADYYDIDVKGAIDTVSTQDTLNRCFLGQQAMCDLITRDENGQITFVTSRPFNLATLHQRGLDIEASYSTHLDSLISSLRGDLTLRALGTHVYFSKRDDGVNPVQDLAGDNSGTGPLKSRWLYSATYTLDPITVSWTGRSLSSGHYGPNYVQCSANCPVSIPSAQTIDYNYISGRFYHDLSISYDLQSSGGTSAQVYLNITNLLDTQPPPVANAQYWYMPTNPQIYDTLGRAFFAGVRFKM
ncbi:MAG TPA: TonB-dependent receptor [Steroidobacteraceae bacterium]|jgi:outer membrane receptor protein involved in Fe transport